MEKRTLLVVYVAFEEQEYAETRTALEAAGVAVSVAATSASVAGHLGTVVQADMLISETHAAGHDAVVSIGGYGYEREDPEGICLGREAVQEGIILAAICPDHICQRGRP